MGEREIERMAPMAARYRRPDWVRRINAMGESLGGGVEGARRMVSLDADAMLEAAERSLGGGAFGDFGDPHWRRRYRALVAAFEARPLNVVGRLMTRQEILRALRTRLRLARAWDANPRLADEPIVAPIIVTGPARSGTTITFELLWLDPDLRGPTAADALHPVLAATSPASAAIAAAGTHMGGTRTAGPRPDGTDHDGPELAARLAMSECEQEFWADVQPEFAAIHELRSDLPVECVTLTQPSFCGGHWAMVGAGAMEMDVVENYAFEKRFLQTLQHGEPKQTWLLKTPGHIMTIDLVFATFPDAWVVQTHRDPVKTMPSTVSTTAMVQWLRCDEVDLPTSVRMINGAFSFGLNSVAERRARGELPKRFVDVHFQSLLRDPVATMRTAYEGMGRDFTAEHADRIRTYLAEKPRGKFGVHKYTPEEWGFTREELRQSLAPYVAHFGIELED
ncbi:MAG: sulfotransferase [Deltaproteobacteria bacterium]|nr:sulfotransferase [Deltaproteobacteria bacterium]